MLNKKEWRERSYLRRMVYDREGGKCYLCRVKLTKAIGRGRQKPTTFTLDHAIPICKGGTTDFGNLRACCLKCNATKGDSFTASCSA